MMANATKIKMLSLSVFVIHVVDVASLSSLDVVANKVGERVRGLQDCQRRGKVDMVSFRI